MFSAASRGIPSFGDLAWKAPVMAAFNQDALPASTLNPAAGVSPGQTLTANANGALQTWLNANGYPAYTAILGDRLLLALEPVPANGIFTITDLGGVGSKWILTRARDIDTLAEMPIGTACFARWGKIIELSGSAIDLMLFTLLDPSVAIQDWISAPAMIDTLTVGGLAVGNSLLVDGDTNVTPTGSILPYGGSAAPSGWLLCNGASILRASFPTLFAVIGTTYGAIDGTHFNVPDLRGRFPLGVDGSHALATTGGAIDHTHTSAAHHHTLGTHKHELPITAAGAANLAQFGSIFGTGASYARTNQYTGAALLTNNAAFLSNTENTPNTGDTTPAATGSNNPPYIALNYIIRAI